MKCLFGRKKYSAFCLNHSGAHFGSEAMQSHSSRFGTIRLTSWIFSRVPAQKADVTDISELSRHRQGAEQLEGISVGAWSVVFSEGYFSVASKENSD